MPQLPNGEKPITRLIMQTGDVSSPPADYTSFIERTPHSLQITRARMDVSIRIKGHLDPSWQEYLEGLQIVQDADGTTRLSGMLPDQSALYGVLNMMSRLNVTLLSLDMKLADRKEINI